LDNFEKLLLALELLVSLVSSSMADNVSSIFFDFLSTPVSQLSMIKSFWKNGSQKNKQKMDFEALIKKLY